MGPVIFSTLKFQRTCNVYNCWVRRERTDNHFFVKGKQVCVYPTNVQNILYHMAKVLSIRPPDWWHPVLTHPKLRYLKLLRYRKLRYLKFSYSKLMHPKLTLPKLRYPKLRYPLVVSPVVENEEPKGFVRPNGSFRTDAIFLPN